MDVRATTAATLEQETRALITRVGRVKPFSLQETLVPAAALAPRALAAIERLLITTRRQLLTDASRYVSWLRGPGRAAAPEEMQRRFVVLRLRFTDLVNDWDTFGDAITQRSETESGVWLAGLDVAAADGLELPGGFFAPPPVVCYLDRGPGGAIRRARTRLSGGAENPVAVVRMPRERMVGHGIASTLMHEVGHQAAALLDLVPSVQLALQARAGEARVWPVWARWASEILADLYAIARVGVSSTLGLISIVSLPRRFVFRIDLTDPHPSPWLRVAVSAALGEALYPDPQPDPQWRRIATLWRHAYPVTGPRDEFRQLLDELDGSIPRLVSALLHHRPPALRGATLGAVLRRPECEPDRLRALAVQWATEPVGAFRASPSLALAVIGQGRSDGRITPEAESRMLAQLLDHWALRTSLQTGARLGSTPSRESTRRLHAA